MENSDSARSVMELLSYSDKTKGGPDTTAKDVISSITLSKSTYTPITMSRYSDDRMSVMPKKGNPPSHDRASDNVEDFFKKKMKDIRVEREWPQSFTPSFIRKHKLDKDKRRTFYGHSYDMVVKDLFNNMPLYVIEIGAIGDDTKHNPSHKDILINDGVAKDWIETNHTLAKFFRINKDDTEYPEALEKIFFGDSNEEESN